MEPEEPTTTTATATATAVVDAEDERTENPPSEEPAIVLGYN